MRKMLLSDILPLTEYEAGRDRTRPVMINHKGIRRVVMGDKLMVTFESRDTMVYQVHEMMRAENIRDEAAIVREIDLYNELVPGPNQFVATVFVTVTTDADMREWMPKLIGIDSHIHIEFAGHRVSARSEPGRNREDKTASVHYVWFDLTPEQAADFQKAPGAAVVCDHPNYPMRAELPRDTFVALRDDLTRE